MKESLFNYRFEYENQKYIFNTNNNGLIQINNDIFTEEEREYLRVNRFWVDDNEDEIALLEREKKGMWKNESFFIRPFAYSYNNSYIT